MRRAAALLLALALAGCASHRVCLPDGAAAAGPPPPDWRDAATDPDHAKLRGVRQAFLEGLAAARAAGFDGAIAAEGRLFDPDAGEDGATLAPGAYRCRSYTLGSTMPGRPAFVAEAPQPCGIEADGMLQRLREQGTPQRLTGRVYPDSPARTVFLGTRVLADEATALHYGRDADRDTAGAINRVGPARWRLAIPRPAWGATIELVEIVPE
ncbi:DUF4893 domain-containing protein [Sphingomonas sp.]|uniref:DUF4893 domain-containing protein n=1 Tax=Sphingomonas sp. TaxID=28214 RepID=UPI003B0044E7